MARSFLSVPDASNTTRFQRGAQYLSAAAFDVRYARALYGGNGRALLIEVRRNDPRSLVHRNVRQMA
jgi:hypothetical protein